MNENNNNSNKSSSWLDTFIDWIKSIDFNPSFRERCEAYNKSCGNSDDGYIGGNYGGF